MFAALFISTGLQTAFAQEVVNTGKSCDPFTKSFAKGAKFTIVDWPGRSDGRGKSNGNPLIIPKLKENQSLVLVDPAITIVAKTEDSKTRIQFSGAKEDITLDGKSALEQPLTFYNENKKKLLEDQRKLSAKQQVRLLSALDLKKSLQHWAIIEDENQNRFRLILKGSTKLQRHLLKKGFVKLEFSKGALVDFKVDEEQKTADIYWPKNPDKSKNKKPDDPTLEVDDFPLKFEDYFRKEFELPFTLSLPMVPVDLDRSRSLSVVNSLRAVERTSLTLTLSQRKTPFGDLVFRGCMAKKSPNGSADQLAWVDIDNIVVTSTKAGSAEIEVAIPLIPVNEKDQWAYERFIGNPLDTIGHIIFNNQDNTRIQIIAADSNGIQYSGITEHFVNSRTLAFMIGLLAFVLAYCLPFWLWQRGGNDVGNSLKSANKRYSVLNLVRGRNGTASLSNLQIWWWSLAVFGLIVFVWVATGGLASFNQSIIILLGITSGGSLFAKAVAINMKDSTQSIAAIQGHTEQVKATWWDLIAAGEQVSITKLQMLIFTIFTGLFVVATVIGQLKFPEIPTELLTLMGVSNGVYVLGKATSSNLYVQLAGLQVKLQAINEQIAANADRKTELEKKKSKIKGKMPDENFVEATLKLLKPLNAELKKKITEIAEIKPVVPTTELSEDQKLAVAKLKIEKTEIEKNIRAKKGEGELSEKGMESSKELEPILSELKSLDALSATKTELEEKIENVTKRIKDQEAAAAKV